MSNELSAKFIFREINPDEAEQAVLIEQTCFPPNEACSRQHMLERIKKASAQFLVAVDVKSGKLAGFLNGLPTTVREPDATALRICAVGKFLGVGRIERGELRSSKIL